MLMADAHTRKERRLNISLAILGVWLLGAPFVLGYSEVWRITANEMGTGLLLFAFMGMRALGGDSHRVIAWLPVYLGFWLGIAPFLLGYSALRTAGFYAIPMWNSVVCGCLIMFLGFRRAVLRDPQRELV